MKLFLLLAIFCLFNPTLGQNEAQSIQVHNKAGFYMNFKASNGGQNSPSTSGYPYGQAETIDLTTTALTEGLETWPVVSAVLGYTRPAPNHFVYRKNCKVAVYTVTGATLSYTITFDGIQDDPRCGAQFIEVLNDGGFVMSFVASNGRQDSSPTSKYPIGQARSIDLLKTPFAENDMVWPVVTAVAGRTEPAPEHVKYVKNGKIASYYVTGATLSFNIVLGSIKDSPSALASAASVSAKVEENKAQKVLIKNRGGFIMNFKATNGEQETPLTDNYPIGESRTIDLATTKLSEGKETWPVVNAVLGLSKPASKHFIYEKNCKVAVYTAVGTSLGVSIQFDEFQVDPACGTVSGTRAARAATTTMTALETELLNEAQRVLIKNRAGFVMNFKVTNGQQSSPTTNNYPIGQEDSIDLANSNLPEGTESWAVVKAILGKTQDASHFIYKKNCKTIIYTVTGTTLNYDINLDGIVSDPTCGVAVAQIIQIENEAGFVMNFQASFGGEDSGPTSNYPIGESRTIDLASTLFPEGVMAWPIVSAVLGKTQAANDHFKYEKNCKTAHYTVRGTTLQYTISFDSIIDTPCRVDPIAQKIAIINSAGFYMYFQVSYGEELTLPSKTYPINDMDTIDLASSTFYTGIQVWPVVSAKAGKTLAANDRIIFDLNCKTAVYKVTGTTLDFDIVYQGLQDDACPLPPGIPTAPGFPLNQVRFINWAKNIDVPNLWSAAPRTRDEVVTVCNWAKDNGYRVRPRGIMHNWSPLTVPDKLPPTAKVLLVDTTKYLYKKQLINQNGKFAVVVETGTTMSDLLEFLEQQDGGKGSAYGFGFPHTPAPGHITVGGVLAINAHGSAVKGQNPNDNFETLGGYGSMSNHIMALTAVVSDNTGKYSLKTFVRGKDQDIKVFLTHLGRTLIVEATLALIDNYNLRCESFMNISAAALFQQPNAPGADPSKWFSTFFAKSGRVEAIWFPFSDNPWMKSWTVSPTKPQESRLVYTPFNYIFAENLSPEQEALFTGILSGEASLTPTFGKLMASISASGLQGKGFDASYPQSYDIWGPSKNTLLYVKDSTLPETANGYAILIKKGDLQQAVADVYAKHEAMLTKYDGNRQWPINGPLEIRVTGLDHGTSTSGSGLFDRPIISSLSVDQTVIDKKWDVAVWFDVLTLPNQYTNQFYVEFETWLLTRFSGDTGRVVPEWSKGWGYTVNQGPWTSLPFLQHIQDTFNTNRGSDDTWKSETATLSKHDGGKLYLSPLLEWLFGDSVVPFDNIVGKEDL